MISLTNWSVSNHFLYTSMMLVYPVFPSPSLLINTPDWERGDNDWGEIASTLIN